MKIKKKYSYPKTREGCTTATVTICGIALNLFVDLQAKHKKATGRKLTNQQTFNYIMNDYFNKINNK